MCAPSPSAADVLAQRAREGSLHGMSEPLPQSRPDIPFLRDVPEGPCAAFLAGGRMIEVMAGSQLMRQGEPAGPLLILLEGRLRVSVMSLSGRELTFRVML